VARSKDEVSRGGDVRKHRLGEELAPGLLYIGVVGGIVRLLAFSEVGCTHRAVF